MMVNKVKKILNNRELFLVFIAIVVFFSMTAGRFLSLDNIANILRNTSIGGLLVLGLTLVMIAGDFDLSFAGAVSLLNLLGLIAIDKGMNMYLAFFLMIVGGVVWELLNAGLVVKLKMHAFIATIASLTLSKGIIYWITKGSTFFGNSPDGLTFIGRFTLFKILPFNTLIFIVMAVAVYLLANRTKFGRHLYAVGGNSDAAEYVGINVNKQRIIAYILSGICVGVATVTLCSKLATAPSTAGDGFQMQAISAAFLGAAVFKMGQVNVGGSILAIFILTTIENGLIMLNVPFYFQYIVQAMILIGAVSFVSKKSKKGEGPAIF
jgi:ribose transport system permease protein